MRSNILLLVLCLFSTSVLADNITFCVDMNCAPAGFTQPYISGNFNSWSGDANPLSNQGNNIWCGTVNISGTIEYKFTHDNWAGQENFNPGDACTLTTGAYTNRIYNVSGDDTVNYAWNSCDTNCPTTYDVELCVDLSCNSSYFTQPYISGSFNGWCGDCNPLTDEGGGIYCTTLNLLQGTALEYKFTLDNWTRQEDFTPGAFCTISSFGFTNRFHYVNSDANLMYGWNSCDTNCKPYRNIEFCVDTDCIPVGYGQLYVSGNFNNWCADCLPLTSQGNGQACGSLLLVDGEYEFKFQADQWANQEQFAGGEPCTKTTDVFTNRTMSVSSDMSYEGVWGACETDCNDISGGNIEFCVCTEGMTGFGQVYVSGSFNGWSGDANPLSDQGDGKWCGTFYIPAGAIQYKFSMDNWANQEYFNPIDPCTFTNFGFTNRVHYVNGDASLEYIWENCESSGLPGDLNSSDLGSSLVPGYVNGGLCSDLDYEIVSSGIGNSYTSDNQHLLHETLCGDGEVYAQINGITPMGWAGIGFRESAAPGAKKAELASNGSYFVHRRIRTVTNGFSFPQQLFRPGQNWLKVVRSGNIFSGYTSINGVNWNFAFSQTIQMASCVEVGAFAQAVNVALSPATATINSLTIVASSGLSGVNKNITQSNAHIASADGLAVYPNPVSNVLRIESFGLECMDCEISLFNNLGQRVALIGNEITLGNTIDMDVSNLQAGIYILKVEHTGEQITRKIIVE